MDIKRLEIKRGEFRSVRAEKALYFFDELLPGWLVPEHEMIAAVKRNKSRAGDVACEPEPLFEWDHRIMLSMQHERWRRYARQQIAHVDVSER